MSFKVMIVDDDAGMRLILRKVIGKCENFEIVKEVENGEEAISFAEQMRPHVIFMDVEMPGINGIESAKRILDINPKTMIIFATAHEEYMPEAFELYAFDYMIKPFKIDRVNQTLARIDELHSTAGNTRSVNHLLKYSRDFEKLVIKNKEGISFISMSDIILVQREDRSTVIYTAEERYVTSDNLSDIEAKLDSSQFFRCHKSYIINISMVYKIYPYGRWTYIVKLKNTDKDALLTHDKFDELQNIFR